MIDKDYFYMLKANDYSIMPERVAISIPDEEVTKITKRVIESKIHLLYSSLANYMIQNAEYFLVIMYSIQVNDDFWLYLKESRVKDMVQESLKWINERKGEEYFDITDETNKILYFPEEGFKLIRMEVINTIDKFQVDFIKNHVLPTVMRQLFEAIFKDSKVEDITLYILPKELETYCSTQFLGATMKYINVHQSAKSSYEDMHPLTFDYNTVKDFKSIKKKMANIATRYSYDLNTIMYIEMIEITIDGKKEVLLPKSYDAFRSEESDYNLNSPGIYRRVNNQVPFTVQDYNSMMLTIGYDWLKTYVDKYTQLIKEYNSNPDYVIIQETTEDSYILKHFLEDVYNYKLMQFFYIYLDQYVRNDVAHVRIPNYYFEENTHVPHLQLDESNIKFKVIFAKCSSSFGNNDKDNNFVISRDNNIIIHYHVQIKNLYACFGVAIEFATYSAEVHTQKEEVDIISHKIFFSGSEHKDRLEHQIELALNNVMIQIGKFFLKYKNDMLNIAKDVEEEFSEVVAKQPKVYYNGHFEEFLTELKYYYNLYVDVDMEALKI